MVLLGELRVTRADGSVVATGSWGTNKTADLLRMLALADGRAVLVEALVGRLWPDAEGARGRGSLRTAASSIRRAVGQDCVVRRHEGLVLTGGDVDVTRFRAATAAVAVAARAGRCEEALRHSEEVERIYRGDFRASDDSRGWAVHARAELRRARLTALLDAAYCALDTGLFREAGELAEKAVALDPSSETAHRALMLAFAEVGEVGNALRVFERYRASLAAELGVDPSPQTRALHQRLLQE